MNKIYKNMEKYKIKLELLLEVGRKIGAKCLVDGTHTYTHICTQRNVLK